MKNEILYKCAEAAHNATVVAFYPETPLFGELEPPDRKDILKATVDALTCPWEGGSPCLGLFVAVARATSNALALAEEKAA